MGELPKRTADTMSMAIALSSPSGRMSKRAKEAAQKRLGEALFGDYERPAVPQPSKKERLLREAKNLRELAARGMSVRAFTRTAAMLEAEAEQLDD